MDMNHGLHGHHDGDMTLGTHGMLLLGGEVFYMSHLPMFMSPHNFQVILEVSLDDTDGSTVRSHQHVVPEEPYDTFVPEDFPMSELDPRGAGPRRTSITGTIFCGHFERKGGQHPPLAKRTIATVQSVVYFAQLDVEAEHQDDRELSYLCFGRGGQLYLAHEINAAPDFDQVLAVRAVPGTATNPLGERLPDDDATLEKFFAERFAVAEPVAIGGRSDKPDQRVAPPETVHGSFFATAPPSGFHGFGVQLEAEREVYMETGDLRKP
ncbi:hypothetical protein GCM10010441_10860 [Kitasatospora paracochleata]|uniref:Uncharacterized protein n=1 Tax=Kitasatospora paracochleata TaxID=58354 RepID=A0ABT1J2Y1_9ACTN|nr:hypothetical protein [Kitasatospora paracochleata]MCP2311488.1 hypothetical protein [Kitasatospora paracochleata]